MPKERRLASWGNRGFIPGEEWLGPESNESLPAHMTFSFADLIATAPITLDLQAANEEEAIRGVADSLTGNPAVADAGRLAREVLEREKLSPTAMGSGVAFPHARTDGVSALVMACGRSVAGVPYRGADGPVHFLFVIGTPPNQAPQYLALVGQLARLLKTDAVRAKLLAAGSAEEIRAALSE